MNNLHRSWCVKNDGSELFRKTVVAYMNSKGRSYSGECVGDFYGVASNKVLTNEKASIHFDNILSLTEFIKATEMTKKNNLPPSWGVKHDNSKEFRKVIDYLNAAEPLTCFNGNSQNSYYGIGRIIFSPICTSYASDFGIILTVDEFIKLTEGVSEAEEYKLTKDAILKMAGESKEVKKSLEKAFPSVFETNEVSIKFAFDGHNQDIFDSEGHLIVAVRNSGPYKSKGMHLSDNYDWIMTRDSEGVLCIVPTKRVKK
jgi:hypothetical protein